jgi:CRP-like cAMP-binding protein
MLGEGEEKLRQRLARCGLPPDALAALFSRHTIVRYPKGSPLVASGSPSDALFAVMTGMVKVYCRGGGASRVLIDLAGPGDLAGYANLGAPAAGKRSLYEAETLTGASVALFTRDHLLRVMRSLEPGTLLALTEMMNSFWSATVHRFAHYLVMSLRERLTDVFTRIAQAYGVRVDSGILLVPELGQEALAEMIGGSRPMVSKLLGEMAADGVIARVGRHYVLAEQQPEIPAGPLPGMVRPITSDRVLNGGDEQGGAAG